MSACWLCPEEFTNQKELVKHLTAAPHSRMNVVCPWCWDHEERVSRIYELRRHLQRTHPEVAVDKLPKDFFSLNNGFWMACSPADYRRAVSPTPAASEVAVEARGRIETWLTQIKAPSRTVESWRQGWEAEIEEPPRKRPVQGYSPSQPGLSVGELSVVDVVPVGDTFAVYLSTSDLTWFQVLVGAGIHGKPKYLEALKRRNNGLKDYVRPLKPVTSGVPLSGQLLEKTREVASDLLGVPEDLIEGIRQLVPGADGDTRTPLSTTESAASKPYQPSTSPVSPTPAPVIRGGLPWPCPSMTKPSQEAAACCTPPGLSQHVPEATVMEAPLTDMIDASPPTLAPLVPTSLKTRAIQILRLGGMPMIPPARRAWDRDGAVQLSSGKNTIAWPPSGWKGYPPAQKLMAVEYAAMMLEFADGIHSTTKAKLMSKYAFLQLPGMAHLKLLEEEQAGHQFRHTMFEAIRQVALSGKGEEGIISMLETAMMVRDRSTDHLIQAIDECEIGFRW